MATDAQSQAAKKNVKKAQQAARSHRTIASMPKATRTALGKQGAAVAQRKRTGGSAPKTRAELYEEAKRRNLPGRSKMGRRRAPPPRSPEANSNLSERPVGAGRFLPEDRGDLRALAAASRNCRGCGLYQEATQTVFGEGPPQPDLMLIGEAPGDKEDIEGSPFVGPAGALLRGGAGGGRNRSGSDLPDQRRQTLQVRTPPKWEGTPP